MLKMNSNELEWMMQGESIQYILQKNKSEN